MFCSRPECCYTPAMQTTPAKGKLFLIVGPSGSGKGSAILQLKKRHPDYVFPVSCTTRSPRPGEKEGEVYSYISKEVFREWIAEGKFLEWAEVHQNNYYGMLKAPIEEALSSGKVVIREIDIQGFKKVISVLPREDVVGIFIVVRDLEELKSRILKRGVIPDEEMARRMESARSEIAQMDLCDYHIDSPSGQVEKMVVEIEGIIGREVA